MTEFIPASVQPYTEFNIVLGDAFSLGFLVIVHCCNRPSSKNIRDTPAHFGCIRMWSEHCCSLERVEFRKGWHVIEFPPIRFSSVHLRGHVESMFCFLLLLWQRCKHAGRKCGHLCTIMGRPRHARLHTGESAHLMHSGCDRNPVHRACNARVRIRRYMLRILEVGQTPVRHRLLCTALLLLLLLRPLLRLLAVFLHDCYGS
mmetsp:Transcript_47818/g.144620  ORF Transcript_47818/g.144620 Transcript_47818/m.144620 type:complete len:202 (-) Transcript_47818:82-687(-)